MTKNPHRSCVFLWGLVFLLFLIIDGDDGKVSQLTLRMVLKALRCTKSALINTLIILFIRVSSKNVSVGFAFDNR